MIDGKTIADIFKQLNGVQQNLEDVQLKLNQVKVDTGNMDSDIHTTIEKYNHDVKDVTDSKEEKESTDSNSN
jgi:DNA-binding protein YbaB